MTRGAMAYMYGPGGQPMMMGQVMPPPPPQPFQQTPRPPPPPKAPDYPSEEQLQEKGGESPHLRRI